jgi:uncharacterized membrane protein YfcA
MDVHNTVSLVELIVVCGIVAGVVSTIAGQGGGLLALLALAGVMGPKEALVLTAPALAIANIHRAWLYRDQVQWNIVGRLSLTVLPASLIVGTLALRAPVLLLRALLFVATGLALAKSFKWLSFRIPRVLFLPAGALIGAFGASSGGAGLLLTPVLISAEITGEALVGTTAATALVLNGGRLIGYTLGGSFGPSLVVLAAWMTVSIIAGNQLGHRVRKWLSERQLRNVELSSMVVATTLMLLGARG